MRKPAECSAHVRLLQEVVRIMRAEPHYRSAARRIRSVEQHCLRMAKDDVERRVIQVAAARMLFQAALDKRASFRTVKQRFVKVLSLPCGYLPSEVTAYTEFAWYCKLQGKPQVGIELLLTLQAEIERQEGTIAKGLLSNCRNHVRHVLQQLRVDPGDEMSSRNHRRAN